METIILTVVAVAASISFVIASWLNHEQRKIIGEQRKLIGEQRLYIEQLEEYVCQKN